MDLINNMLWLNKPFYLSFRSDETVIRIEESKPTKFTNEAVLSEKIGKINVESVFFGQI